MLSVLCGIINKIVFLDGKMKWDGIAFLDANALREVKIDFLLTFFFFLLPMETIFASD